MQTSRPEEAGLSSARLGRMSQVMQSYVDQNKLAGLVAMLARRGRLVYSACFGVMDVQAGKPMQPDTIVRLRSMTKPITAVAVMMLYEEGHFQLADPVSRFIPEFKGGQALAGQSERGLELVDLEREITIHDLLIHTSGLASGFGEDQPLEALYQEVDADSDRLDITLQDLVHKLASLPRLHQPGRAWRYGWSYAVLGHLVEVISGMPFDAFLRHRVFEPLDMPDTSFRVPGEKTGRFATLYGPAEEGGLAVVEGPGQNWKTAYPISGTTGLVSTAHDYMRFAQMLLNGGELEGARLLGRKTVELMTLNHVPAELLPIAPLPDSVLHGYGYGLGVAVLMDVAQARAVGTEGSFGWGGYASTDFWVDPREELVGLIMAQFAPLGYYPLTEKFQVLAYQAMVD